MPVSQIFCLKGFLQRDFFVQINGHKALVHVEAHIVRTKQFKERIGKDVFPAMLLHVVQPVGPVHLHRDFAAHGKIRRALVDNLSFRFPHMFYRGTVNRSRITELPAPFREQHRPIQHNGKSLGRLFAFQHRRLTGF